MLPRKMPERNSILRQQARQAAVFSISTPTGAPRSLANCDLLHSQRQNGPVDFTLATDFHFIFPASLGRALADCSIDKPAQMSGIKLPCGTIPPALRRATPRQPARLILFRRVVYQSKNKEDLTFDMHRYVPPTLLETLNGLGRNAQNLCHLVLRFPQMSSNFCELLFLHPRLFSLYGFPSYHNGVREGSAPSPVECAIPHFSRIAECS